MQNMTYITRFAPSPTGPLHLGHAYSAMVAHQMARENDGQFLLRIDDLDQSRARPQWEDQIYEDLTWLGLGWDGPVRKQSDHFTQYAEALASLRQRGLTFECTCSRRDIETAANAPQEGVPNFGPDGRIYPGTCRTRDHPKSEATCTRLNMSQACALEALLCFTETGPAHRGRHVISPNSLTLTVGDVVLERRAMAAAYHLAVAVDDAATGITHVVRGEDLFDATQIHVVLHVLLGGEVPTFHHHAIIRDDAGKRLAKRDDARAIATFRAEGATPADIRKMVGL